MNADSSVRREWLPIALVGLLAACFGVVASANVDEMNPGPVAADATEQQAAAKQYAASLRTLLEKQIVPALHRGIVVAATSRPHSLTIEITDDPSPYNVGAKVGTDGALTVRLSIGYVMIHDAALDAVAMATALNRSRDLQKYLMYQLAFAHAAYANHVRGESVQRVMTFGEFAGVDVQAMRALFEQRQWREARGRVEVESLGWTIAYLLVRADSRLAGRDWSSIDRSGAGAARLAASSGWFPVPPYATALGVAELGQLSAAVWDVRALLCRAAQLMEGGIGGLRADSNWSTRLRQDGSLRRRVSHIESQIAAMRHDGGCRLAPQTTS